MIAVRLQGRLGNQLFQYAFAYAASKKLGTGYYIDEYIERSSVARYFHISNKHRSIVHGLFGIKGYKNIFSFHLRRWYYGYLAAFYKLITQIYDTCPVATVTIQNNVLYQGFFQSYLFSTTAEVDIRSYFTLKDRYKDAFRKKYGSLYNNNNVVAVHIRRTDYQALGHLNLGGDDLSLPIDYYDRAIHNFKGQQVHFVFISDDPDFAANEFKHINNKTIVHDTEIMDFQHMLNANACIISNSTFSWWGAWLNASPDKIVYAPKYFLGWRVKMQYPPEIYPPDWIEVEFIC